MRVPLSRPSISESEIAQVVEVLRSGWLAHGEFNRRFESEFAQLIGVKHAVSMNSCTSALEAALVAAGVCGEVVVPSFTWVATANAVVCAGATPVFCEVDPRTRNVTAATLSERITPRTEAAIAVHYGGQPCAMDEIAALCEKRHLLLIEDSAETLGATWRGRQAGSFGVGCFSFFPTKNITTAEGGMLVCQDDALAASVRALIAHGLDTTTLERERAARPWWRAAMRPGHNYRMPNPLAALGWGQLRRLAEMNQKRASLAARYDAELAPLAPRVLTPRVVEGATHSYQMYTIEVPAELRDPLVHGLRRHGVEASVHFDPPVHLHPCYAGHALGGEGLLPVTERLAREIITLPMYPDLTEEQQRWVVCSLRDEVQRLTR